MASHLPNPPAPQAGEGDPHPSPPPQAGEGDPHPSPPPQAGEGEERYLCIHGHFYQPPRENPWLEAIELQDSAYPYHDWNERITAECYGPNATSRILDDQGRISKIVNNYSRISFNFGPTLLAWLEAKATGVYLSILEADRQSTQRFSGHGSALAQPYNHMIMPLANRRDRRTQVLWGLRDFEHRFRRSAEGMWLPETAVDLDTLEVMAELGVAFTILEPHQARRIRTLGAERWQDVSGGRIDPTRPYRLQLPSGRTIDIFFYDGPVSRAVAFEKLLASGERFAGRLTGLFDDQRKWPQVVHIATDGETYGHHHRHGDMALAYALEFLDSNPSLELTNYGEYLERHPPTHQVEIVEDTSWSCAHGVERWRSDCGCSTGMNQGWNQSWRQPLREALDWLRDALGPPYERRAGAFLTDPWAARDDYLDVILDRSPESVEKFFGRHATEALRDVERTTVLKLLELQRHAMLMYTSCGWFFDELSGIETVQVIQYAGRALQLSRQLFEEDLEPRFLELLELARSNLPAHRDGRRVYERFVEAAMVDLAKVGAHYAMSSLFEDYVGRAPVYCYQVEREDHRRLASGRSSLALGRARVESNITGESARLDFGVLHFGDHGLTGSVRAHQGAEPYQAMMREVGRAFERADLPETIRNLDRHFGAHRYSLRSLFRDQQRKIVNLILESTLQAVTDAYRQVYEHHAPLMRFLTDLGIPLPNALHSAAEVVLNADLHRAFSDGSLDPASVQSLLEETEAWGLGLDRAGLGYSLQQVVEQLLLELRASPQQLPLLERLEGVVDLARTSPLQMELTSAQNIFYELRQKAYPELHRSQGDDPYARAWVRRFRSLGDKLGVRVEPAP
ncbi:MAG: DUF3536 domain-containing protein [Actinomycetota bacterium]|nr:DUF3536 domain-containing protein [Actinomycetota bacterium]